MQKEHEDTRGTKRCEYEKSLRNQPRDHAASSRFFFDDIVIARLLPSSPVIKKRKKDIVNVRSVLKINCRGHAVLSRFFEHIVISRLLSFILVIKKKWQGYFGSVSH